jgi:uncharacterized membrane protein
VYVFTFADPWRSLIDDGLASYAAPPLVYIVIAATAILVGVQWLAGSRDQESHAETAILGVLLAIAGIVATWPAWTGYSIVFNAIFFAAAAGIVVHGYMRGDERYINFGLLLVALGVLTRYVDVFWSELAGSAFFIIGGLLLLGGAFALERIRRTLVTSMDEPGEVPPSSATPAIDPGAAP